MKIRIYSLLLCGFALGSLSALAQQSPLLGKVPDYGIGLQSRLESG